MRNLKVCRKCKSFCRGFLHENSWEDGSYFIYLEPRLQCWYYEIEIYEKESDYVELILPQECKFKLEQLVMNQ